MLARHRRLSPGGRRAVLAGPGVVAPQIIEQVLVKVNGDIITKTELEEKQIAALRQRNLNPESSRTTSS